jgi:putative sigma-54 modulation protein
MSERARQGEVATASTGAAGSAAYLERRSLPVVEFEITGRHMEVTAAMERQIRQHIDKLPRFDSQIQYLTVMLGMESGNNQVEITAKCHRSDLIAEAQGHDMYQVIDEAFGKMKRQVVRLHDKLTDH